jgi:hypothetical protein
MSSYTNTWIAQLRNSVSLFVLCLCNVFHAKCNSESSRGFNVTHLSEGSCAVNTRGVISPIHVNYCWCCTGQLEKRLLCRPDSNWNQLPSVTNYPQGCELWYGMDIGQCKYFNSFELQFKCTGEGVGSGTFMCDSADGAKPTYCHVCSYWGTLGCVSHKHDWCCPVPSVVYCTCFISHHSEQTAKWILSSPLIDIRILRCVLLSRKPQSAALTAVSVLLNAHPRGEA